MKARKITAVLLAATMLISIASCSDKKSKKDKEKSSDSPYTDFAEDMNYKKLNVSKIKKLSNDSEEYLDGVYSYATEESDVKALTKKFDSSLDAETVEAIFYLEQMEPNQYEDEFNSFGFYAVTFKDEDDAESFFEEYAEYMKDTFTSDNSTFTNYGTSAMDNDDDYFIYALDLDIQGSVATVRVGVYLNDSDVITVISKAYYDAAYDYADLTEEFLNEYDLESIGDLLLTN